MKYLRPVAFLCAILLASGCASLGFERCPSGLKRAPMAELVFGRNIGGALSVSDAAWAAFVDREVSPRFPNGLSVLDMQGEWRGPDGVLVREPSKALILVLSGAKSEDDKLAAIRNAYKQEFKQDSVLLIRSTACVGF
jgi:Protein of unknown function (DUF3574)